MNADIFVFGNFPNGHSQYPCGDDKKQLFNECIRLAKSPTQIVIHREGSLMYYSYIRKLSYGHCIGFCVAINGGLFKNSDVLFDVFENTIDYLARNRILIKIDRDGSVMANTDDLAHCPVDVDEACSHIRGLLEDLPDELGTLPPINYGLQNDGVKQLNYDDDQEAILNFSYKAAYVVVCKNADYDTESLLRKMSQIRLTAEQNKLQQNKEEAPLQKINTTAPQTDMLENKKMDKESKEWIFWIIAVFLATIFMIIAVSISPNKTDNVSVEEVAEQVIDDEIDDDTDDTPSFSFDEDLIKQVIESYCNAIVENDYYTLESLYTPVVQRFQGTYNETRSEVLGHHKRYDERYGVYGKYSYLRWDTFSIENSLENAVMVSVVEDYALDREDPTALNKFVLKVHFVINTDYQIESVWDEQLEATTVVNNYE